MLLTEKVLSIRLFCCINIFIQTDYFEIGKDLPFVLVLPNLPSYSQPFRKSRINMRNYNYKTKWQKLFTCKIKFVWIIFVLSPKHFKKIVNIYK